MEPKEHPRAPHSRPRGSQVTPRWPKVTPRSPKVSQRLPKDIPKARQKAAQDPPGTKKVSTFSKLGFVHRRSVFEPPEPKVDYHYYVFATMEILILVEGRNHTNLGTPGDPSGASFSRPFSF